MGGIIKPRVELGGEHREGMHAIQNKDAGKPWI